MKRPVGVFDSGLGGLSVVESIRRLLPNEELIYVADSKHCPYGEKSEVFLRQRAEIIGDYLVGEKCKAIVIACNTATAAATATMRRRFAVPVVAVEPAVKPAAAMTRSGVVAVLATRATLLSAPYAQLLERHAGSLQVIGEDCPGWVEAVERGDLDCNDTATMVRRRIEPLLGRGVDTFVLGCTHFPFLRAHIERVAGPGVTVLDTGVPVARQLHKRLDEEGILNSHSGPPRHRFLSTQLTMPNAVFVRRVWPDVGAIEEFSS